MRTLRIALAVFVTLSLVVPAASGALPGGATIPAVPIPQDPGDSLVVPFLGEPREAKPINGAKFAPGHPFMASNDRSNLHNDAYQSDAGVAPIPFT